MRHTPGRDPFFKFQRVNENDEVETAVERSQPGTVTTPIRLHAPQTKAPKLAFMRRPGLPMFEKRIEIHLHNVSIVFPMTKLKPAELAFWQDYRRARPQDQVAPDAVISASVAGDKRNADELLQLYLDKKKTAGSSLIIDYETSGDPLPKVGNFWIILDSSGVPKCIVKCVGIEIHRFDQVPEKIAIAEGEGDLSLGYWTKAHREFFEPYLPRWKVTDLDKERVITEFFDVVWTSKP